MEQNESPCFICFDTRGGQNNHPTFTKIYIVALVPHAQSLLVRVFLQLLLSHSTSLIATFYKYICVYGRQNMVFVYT